MKELKTLNFMTEAFDKPYSFRVVDSDDKGYFVEWVTANGIKFDMTIEAADRSQPTTVPWNATFKSHGKSGHRWTFSMTGEGDEFRIMSTALSVLKSFAKKYPQVKVVQFTADKGDTGSSSRQKVYSRMIKRYLPSGWTSTEKRADRGNILYVLKRK
jgi:hypothetical protein